MMFEEVMIQIRVQFNPCNKSKSIAGGLGAPHDARRSDDSTKDAAESL